MAFGTQDDADEVMNEINMTPLVDVMLVLLIMFIITIPLQTHAVKVDVPQATVMVVMDAERFGISQLHQLRGRVGRGGLPGLCLLVTRAEDGADSRVRLDAVAGLLGGLEPNALPALEGAGQSRGRAGRARPGILRPVRGSLRRLGDPVQAYGRAERTTDRPLDVWA